MKLFGIILGLLLLVGCAFTQTTDSTFPDRKVWFGGEAHNLAHLGQYYDNNDDKRWRNVGEIAHPLHKDVMVIFWDYTDDCQPDVGNLYFFYTVEESLGELSEDAWILNGYTRDGLVASRTQETGLEDLPDAYFIGRYCIDNLL